MPTLSKEQAQKLQSKLPSLPPEQAERVRAALEASGFGAPSEAPQRSASAFEERGAKEGFFQPVQPDPGGLSSEQLPAEPAPQEFSPEGTAEAITPGSTMGESGQTPPEELPAQWSPEGRGDGVSSMLTGQDTSGLPYWAAPFASKVQDKATRIDWFDPMVGMYERETGRSLADAPDPEHDPGFVQFKNERWKAALADAQSKNRPIRRMDVLIEQGDPELSDQALSLAKSVMDAGYGVGQGAFAGLPSALDPEYTEQALDNTAGTVGYVGGMLNPMGAAGGVASRVAKGVNPAGLAGGFGRRSAAAMAGGAAAAGVQDVGEEVSAGIGGKPWGRSAQDAWSRLAFDVPLSMALGPAGEMIAGGARNYRSGMRGGVFPEGGTNPNVKATAVPSQMATDLQSMDRAGASVRGTSAMTRGPVDFPYEMQDYNLRSKPGIGPEDVAAGDLRPKMDTAALEVERRIDRAAAPVVKFEQESTYRVPAVAAFDAANDIFKKLYPGGRPLPGLEGEARMMQKLSGDFLDFSVRPVNDVKKYIQGKGGRTRTMNLSEAIELFGSKRVTAAKNAWRKAMGKPPEPVDVTEFAQPMDAVGPVTDPAGTMDPLATDPAPFAGSDMPVESPTMPSEGGGPEPILPPAPRVPKEAVKKETGPRLKVIVEPRRMTAQEIDRVLGKLDEEAKMLTAQKGSGGPTESEFKRLSAALREARDLIDDGGAFAGKRATVPVVGRFGETGTKEVTGYSAAKHELERMIQDSEDTLRGAGYQSNIKERVRLGNEPAAVRIDPNVARNVQQSLSAVGDAPKLTQDAFDELARIHQEVSGNAQAQAELRNIRAFIGANRIGPAASITGSGHAVVTEGGPKFYGGGQIARALKLKSDAFARVLSQVGHDYPIPEGILKVIRGVPGVSRGELFLGSGGFAGPLSRQGLPPIMPDIGMAGGVTPGLGVVTYNQLSPDEKLSLVTLLMEEEPKKQEPTE